MQVTVRYFDGCPNWLTVADELADLAEHFDADVAYEPVETPEAAERLGFRGSPTVLIDGRDPFAIGDEPTGMACRVYPTPEGYRGAPTRRQLRDALEAAAAR